MRKEDLIHALARTEGLTTAKANHIVDTLIEEITEELLAGGRIKFRNFGTFTVTVRKGKQFKNPKTGEMSIVSERHYPVFIPSKSLKEKVQKEGFTHAQ